MFIIFFILLLFTCTDNITKEDNFNKLDDNIIKIGFLGSYSYELANGDSYYYEALLAIRQINMAGGINGREVALIPEDTKTNPDTAIAAAKRLLEKGVIAIVGPITSGNTIAVAKNVAIPNNIPLITPWATSPEITNLDDNDLVWRTIPSDIFQGMAAAKYIFYKLKKNTCSIIYIDNPYGVGLMNSFKENYTEFGGTIYNIVKYKEDILTNNNEKMKMQKKLDSLFLNSPEIVYFITYDYDGAYILNKLYEMNIINENYRPIFFGCDGNTKTAFLVNIINLADFEFYSTIVASSGEKKYFMQFKDDFENFFEYPFPFFNTGNVYDAASVLLYAIASAGSLNGEDIVANIPKVTTNGGDKIFYNEFQKGLPLIDSNKNIDYDGVFSALDFDEHGDIKKASYVIQKVENNQFITVDTINIR